MRIKNLLYKSICISMIFILSMNYITFAKCMDTNTSQTISKEYVYKLIKQQSKESLNSIEWLSYKLVDLDNDNNLEIVARMLGGAHSGYFYIFHKDAKGDYKLIVEKPWAVNKWDLEKVYRIQGLDIPEYITLYEVVDNSGGTGLDEYTAYLWYIKDGKFFIAWKDDLQVSSYYHNDHYLKLGGYNFYQGDNKIYYWTYETKTNLKTNENLQKPFTTLELYKFDGIKFILDKKSKCNLFSFI